MDGIDGIVGSCMLISLITSCIVLEIDQNFLFLIGSLAAFIVWNWHPAKLFMGDIGSTFLAAINIGLILQSNNFIQAIGLLLVLGPCLIDPFTCVIRRFFYGENIFSAHSEHFYQQKIRKGYSHANVLNKIFSINLLLALFSLIYFKSPILSIILSILMVIYLLKWLGNQKKKINANK